MKSLSNFDMIIYRLFYWRFNKRMADDKKLRDFFRKWLDGFEEKVEI